MAPTLVTIRHPKLGLEYQVTLADYRHAKAFIDKDGQAVTYQTGGFEIVSLASGEPFDPPASHDEPKARAD